MAEPIVYPSITVNDFSGGITDNIVGAQLNQAEKLDNFSLEPFGERAKAVTRPGSAIYDALNPQIPLGQSRIGSMFDLEDQLFYQSARNVYFIEGGTFDTLTGPTGNPVFGSGTVANYASYASWNKHVIACNDALSSPQRIFKDGTNAWQSHNLGLPEVTDSINLTCAVNTSKSYLYAFVWSVEYTIGSVIFKEYGAPRFEQIENADAPQTTDVVITGLPTISNGLTENYDTTGIKLEIYRTINNGDTFYKVTEVSNGTASFNDDMPDTDLQTQPTLYTTGDILANDAPPQAKYVIQAGEITWYLHCKEGASTYPNRMRPSKPSQPSACPASFAEDLDDEIVGAGVIGTTPIIFCKSRIYRIEGFYDDAGQGSITKRELYRVDGCVSHRSIVTVPEGLCFAGQNGFYFTDGQQVIRISEDIPTSYRRLMQTDALKAQIYGVYDNIKNRVMWAGQQDTASEDNDVVYLAHLRWNASRKVPFTTWSGGSDTDNFAPSSLHFYRGDLIRGDRRGYIFKHDIGYLVDPKVDIDLPVADWQDAVIFYDYRSVAIDFGTSRIRKWVPKIIVTADNVTNLSLLISSNNDKSGVFRELKEIKTKNNLTWGDKGLTWGDVDLVWNYVPLIEEWRRFPAKTLRCVYKQVRFSNAFTEIENSINSGTASIDSGTKTLTIETSPNVWPEGAVDYFIVVGGSANQLKILSRSDTVITVEDPTNTLTDGAGQEWVIKGYRKGEILSLLEYVIDYQPLTTTQNTYQAGS